MQLAGGAPSHAQPPTDTRRLPPAAGALPLALSRYKQVHGLHPTNVECLRYLVHLCGELGRRDDAQEYAERLRRAERVQVGWGQTCADGLLPAWITGDHWRSLEA